ncbi:pilus assembly protein FimT [Ectopseudomonas mendocina]|uniref:Type II secretion system protein H n=1 Tax=Ectopseudomonas mendocina TaxID=300 RepID=A0ABD7RXH9_ECTME|nr:GspH/FimT family pseudopilin [Pseudomonas mendocina]TRO15277.1 pilus assembly protein FimT [Pseudomonas mendocina]TRO18064.1 pilus assembly protein FimT [Pseudomonas mendocina]
MRTNHVAGYSLLNLLTTITIAAVLTGIAVPSTSAWHERQQLRSLKSGLFQMTTQARYLAMTSQSRVTLCALSEQGHCQQSWHGSISSFIDLNGNRRLDPGEEIISTLYLPSSISLHWRGMQPNNSIHFSSQGVTFVSNGTMSLCPTKANTKTGTIVISRQGRVKSSYEGARCTQ